MVHREVRLVLVVAHPGHELRVHGHLERTSPLVLVLTDGSGRTGRSRLARTGEVLRQTGARPGPVYGRLTDREIYAALREGRHDLFVGLAREIAASLVKEAATAVAGDAAEGFNPAHDVCRLVVNAAVAMAAREGLLPRNLEFPLDAAPGEGAGDAEFERLVLDDGELARKDAAARAYAELDADVRSALDRFGLEAFRAEVLRPVRYGFDLRGRIGDPPFYEVHGERRVREGAYDDVLRFVAHVEPLARTLAAEVASCASS